MESEHLQGRTWEMLGETAAASAGVEMLVGFSGKVLGIFSIIGPNAQTLSLIGLLGIGSGVLIVLARW